MTEFSRRWTSLTADFKILWKKKIMKSFTKLSQSYHLNSVSRACDVALLGNSTSARGAGQTSKPFIRSRSHSTSKT